MEIGTNKSLFTLIAVVIFGFFLSLSYWMFQSELPSVLASVFDKTSIVTNKRIDDAEFIGKNLLINGSKLVEGPVTGWSGNDTDGIEGKEFIQHLDLAPIIDRFGVGTYTISFDLKTSPKTGPVRVYVQNGASSKYNLWTTVDSTTDWKRYSVVVDIQKTEGIYYDPNRAILAFYGTYNTQVSPSVKNVNVQLGEVTGIPDYEEAPLNLAY